MQITSGLPEGFNAGAYDMIVVGAGYAGAVCARRLAETIGYRVAVLERRSHIAGNAYDCTDEAGILIHEYGPHIYHTFNERVHNFLSRFTKWTDYQHKVLANINGTLMPVPFNHASLKLAFGDERGEELYQKLVETFGKDVKVPIETLMPWADLVTRERLAPVFFFFLGWAWATPSSARASASRAVRSSRRCAMSAATRLAKRSAVEPVELTLPPPRPRWTRTPRPKLVAV